MDPDAFGPSGIGRPLGDEAIAPGQDQPGPGLGLWAPTRWQQAAEQGAASAGSGGATELGIERGGHRYRPARGQLTEQGHVPLPPGQRAGQILPSLMAGPQAPAQNSQPHFTAERTLLDLPPAPSPRHFLTGAELSRSELEWLLARAAALKAEPLSARTLAGRTIALIFQAASTRTRVSFEAGIFELGGHPMVLDSEALQLSRGESVRDTAYILSRHAAAIGLRTGPHQLAVALAEHAAIPVINMLTAEHHPCQALADLLTLREAFGELDGLTLAYVGDGNNVARSLAILGALAGVQVRVAAPEGYQLEPVAGAILLSDPREAVSGADALYTDVWVSMSDDPTSVLGRRRDLREYRIDEELLDLAAPRAIVLHCLPAHPGEEITEGILYGERQRIWDQAENRRHAQKALLELLLTG